MGRLASVALCEFDNDPSSLSLPHGGRDHPSREVHSPNAVPGLSQEYRKTASPTSKVDD